MKDIVDAGNNDIHNHGGKISHSGNVEQSISQSNSIISIIILATYSSIPSSCATVAASD